MRRMDRRLLSIFGAAASRRLRLLFGHARQHRLVASFDEDRNVTHVGRRWRRLRSSDPNRWQTRTSLTRPNGVVRFNGGHQLGGP